MYKDLYIILGLTPDATQIDIKKAYRKLALKYHPDKNFGNKELETKFREAKEAYETLSNEELRKSYDLKFKNFKNASSNPKTETKTKSTQDQKDTNRNSFITPSQILAEFENLEKTLWAMEKSSIDQRILLNRFNYVTATDFILLLRKNDDLIINSKIVSSALKSLKKLDYGYQPQIIEKLVKISGTDNEVLKKIFEFSERQKRLNYLTRANYYWQKYPRLIILILLILFITVISMFDGKNTENQANRPKSGDLYSDSIKTRDSSVNASTQILDSTLKLKKHDSIRQEDYSSWNTTNYSTGSSPGCFNFIPRYDRSLNNHLEVTVGSNTDAVIKLINISNEKCIRYCFVRGGDTYNLTNIPQGKYYLKIAYGSDWRQKVENNICKGKFVYNALYEKGSEVLDFYKVNEGIEVIEGKRYRHSSLPSYKLNLEIITSDTTKHFQTNKISETDFNN